MNESICCRIYRSSDTCAEILDVLFRLHDNSAAAIHTIADSDWLLGRDVSALIFKAHRSRTLRQIWVNQSYFQQRVRFLHFHCVLWEWKNSWNSKKGQQENSSCSSFSSHFLLVILTHTVDRDGNAPAAACWEWKTLSPLHVFIYYIKHHRNWRPTGIVYSSGNRLM